MMRPAAMARRQKQPQDTVYIVEDDDDARALYSAVVRSMGLGCEAFPLATDFLERCDALGPGCLLLDLVLPDVSGLALQHELTLRGITIPIIFVTNKGQVASAVEAMRQGAFNFLEKSFSNAELMENIRQAIALDHSHRRMLDRIGAIRGKLESLTRREHDVLTEVVSGQSNKTIAHKLSLSQRSIEMHRSRLMEKMGADSVAELVKMLLSVERGQSGAPPGSHD
jgi:two-component system, LuxR family, response regulator FixJ